MSAPRDMLGCRIYLANLLPEDLPKCKYFGRLSSNSTTKSLKVYSATTSHISYWIGTALIV